MQTAQENERHHREDDSDLRGEGDPGSGVDDLAGDGFHCSGLLGVSCWFDSLSVNYPDMLQLLAVFFLFCWK